MASSKNNDVAVETVDDEYPIPARFSGVEVPPPKTRCVINFAEEMKRSRNRLWRKRCLGKDPGYKGKRQRQRFSLVLLDHYVATRQETYEYEKTHWYWCSGMDQVELKPDMDDLDEELGCLHQVADEIWEDCIPRRLIEAMTEIEIKMYERTQEFKARHKMAA